MIPDKAKRFVKNIWAVRNIFIVFLAFIIPLDLATSESKASKCAYGVIAMAILWLTEALPIPVTALLPAVIFPLLGVASGKTVCSKYINETSMLFLGGLIVAVAVEEVGLHRRVAMGIISILGSNPNMLMLGLMVPTWFLSMWISNTAATSMMIPIIHAVMLQVREAEQLRKLQLKNTPNTTSESQPLCNGVKTEDKPTLKTNETISEETGKGNEAPQNDTTINVQDKYDKGKKTLDEDPSITRFGKGLALSVAYGANAGGIATLTGTPPNLILQGMADSIFKEQTENADSGITFANWMAFAFPLSIIILVISWMWLQLVFLRSLCCRKPDEFQKKAINKAIKEERKKLGNISFGEIVVLICFVCLAMLWIFRDIPGFGGWASLFYQHPEQGPYARDSTSAMLIAISLFILPKTIPNVFCSQTSKDKPTYTPILTWDKVTHKLPWGVIMLLGGGFALADASSKSGLSKMVGCNLMIFTDMDIWVMNFIICLIVAAATEITSNSATATLLMPIMAELALSLGKNPLYLMISSAVACSFAFMLPVATPPNAIVFSTGILRIPDMALAGLAMNVIAILSLTLAINTWGIPLFSLDIVPALFNSTGLNSTCV